MPSLNKAFLLGHVGHTPKLSQTRSGQQATRVSLATSQTIYRADGTKEQRTEWHNVVAYGRLAENICAYVQKGNLLWVEGRDAHARIHRSRRPAEATHGSHREQRPIFQKRPSEVTPCSKTSNALSTHSSAPVASTPGCTPWPPCPGIKRRRKCQKRKLKKPSAKNTRSRFGKPFSNRPKSHLCIAPLV